LILAEGDNGKSFDIRLGAQFAVQLDEAPTTGYRWRIDVDGDAATLQATDFQSAEAGVGGGGGRVSFIFAAKKRAMRDCAASSGKIGKATHPSSKKSSSISML
jgi:predicted secreted protein